MWSWHQALIRGCFHRHFPSVDIMTDTIIKDRYKIEIEIGRGAMALATDRERLSSIFLQGLSFPASGGFIPPGMPRHAAGIALPYNPEESRRLLAEAGYGGRASSRRSSF